MIEPLSAECQRMLDAVRKRCPGLLPAEPVPAGTVVAAVELSTKEADSLFPSAAATVSGAQALGADPVAAVLWREGDRTLLVRPAEVSARFGPGVVVVTVPVECDQTGPTSVYVTFVVGTDKTPAGLLASTEERPRGPAAVVDAWGESLVAYAWHVLIAVVTDLAGAAGRDLDGSRLVPTGLEVDADSVRVTPMARHPFDRVRG